MTARTDPGPQKTGQQLRQELITAVNAGIAASGLPDGWEFLMGEPWDPEMEEFLGAHCSTTSNSRRQLFEVGIVHALVGDPRAFVNVMGDYWKDRGYTVSPVSTPTPKPNGDIFIAYRADRPDGSLAAGVTTNARSFILDFYTECSTDPTLDDFAGPTGYRTFDPLEQNPYHPTNSPTITPYPDR